MHRNNKPSINVGTIGHVNHGETMLTTAVTLMLNGIEPNETEAALPRKYEPYYAQHNKPRRKRNKQARW